MSIILGGIYLKISKSHPAWWVESNPAVLAYSKLKRVGWECVLATPIWHNIPKLCLFLSFFNAIEYRVVI